MRKATICFLVTLWAVLAAAQQPQWSVVDSVSLFAQNQSIAQTTLLTPTEPGMYRLTFYFSASGLTPSPAYFDEVVTMQDISGQSDNFDIPLKCSGGAPFFSATSVISLKPTVPLTYAVNAAGNPGDCAYNLTITVEQLVQQ